MGVGSGLYMYDVVVKRRRSLSHLLMSSCCLLVNAYLPSHWRIGIEIYHKSYGTNSHCTIYYIVIQLKMNK